MPTITKTHPRAVDAFQDVSIPREKCICGSSWMPDHVGAGKRPYMDKGVLEWRAFECPECGRRGPAVPVESTDLKACQDAAKAWDQERRNPDGHDWMHR